MLQNEFIPMPRMAWELNHLVESLIPICSRGFVIYGIDFSESFVSWRWVVLRMSAWSFDNVSRDWDDGPCWFDRDKIAERDIVWTGKVKWESKLSLANMRVHPPISFMTVYIWTHVPWTRANSNKRHTNPISHFESPRTLESLEPLILGSRLA